MNSFGEVNEDLKRCVSWKKANAMRALFWLLWMNGFVALDLLSNVRTVNATPTLINE